MTVYILIAEHAYVPGTRVHAYKTAESRQAEIARLRDEFGRDVTFEEFETGLEE
jgi:hypothetical protein